MEVVGSSPISSNPVFRTTMQFEVNPCKTGVSSLVASTACGAFPGLGRPFCIQERIHIVTDGRGVMFVRGLEIELAGHRFIVSEPAADGVSGKRSASSVCLVLRGVHNNIPFFAAGSSRGGGDGQIRGGGAAVVEGAGRARMCFGEGGHRRSRGGRWFEGWTHPRWRASRRAVPELFRSSNAVVEFLDQGLHQTRCDRQALLAILRGVHAGRVVPEVRERRGHEGARVFSGGFFSGEPRHVCQSRSSTITVSTRPCQTAGIHDVSCSHGAAPRLVTAPAAPSRDVTGWTKSVMATTCGKWSLWTVQFW